MLITYTPADGEKREFEFRPGKLGNLDAEAIEDATGWTYAAFGERFLAGSMKAARAVLWICLRAEQGQHRLKFSEVSFTADELSIDYDAAEAAQLREAIEANPDIDPEQREAVLAVLDQSAIRHMEKDVEPGPKEPGTAGSPDESGTGPGESDTPGA